MTADKIWDFVELVERVKREPSLLDDPLYPPEFVGLLRPMVIKEKAGSQTIDDLQSEIQNLYEELNTFSPGLAQEDRDTYTQYLKLKASLIGKLVELKERTMNLRTLKSFQDRVLLAVDKVMTAEQRTEFMKALEA